jgi:hypothetical protein
MLPEAQVDENVNEASLESALLQLPHLVLTKIEKYLAPPDLLSLSAVAHARLS